MWSLASWCTRTCASVSDKRFSALRRAIHDQLTRTALGPGSLVSTRRPRVATSLGRSPHSRLLAHGLLVGWTIRVFVPVTRRPTNRTNRPVLNLLGGLLLLLGPLAGFIATLLKTERADCANFKRCFTTGVTAFTEHACDSATPTLHSSHLSSMGHSSSEQTMAWPSETASESSCSS